MPLETTSEHRRYDTLLSTAVLKGRKSVESGYFSSARYDLRRAREIVAEAQKSGVVIRDFSAPLQGLARLLYETHIKNCLNDATRQLQGKYFTSAKSTLQEARNVIIEAQRGGVQIADFPRQISYVGTRLYDGV